VKQVQGSGRRALKKSRIREELSKKIRDQGSRENQGSGRRPFFTIFFIAINITPLKYKPSIAYWAY
jgi:hypothetical protein